MWGQNILTEYHKWKEGEFTSKSKYYELKVSNLDQKGKANILKSIIG